MYVRMYTWIESCLVRIPPGAHLFGPGILTVLDEAGCSGLGGDFDFPHARRE